ncbi:PREDICTED: venom protease-like [Cyphomyrmex costatus]|uniref:venom protease-like n=1 Tax=Cyphomyrmex costatus TaxID=456900 RepID=UPI0008522E12|nr:PREDICTED: venom protease-like [Cyphomyrmex costatus]
MRAILVFIGLLCALILPLSEGNTRHINLKSDREFRQSTNSTSVPLDPPEYGYNNSSVHRIVGGRYAKLGEFPWAVLIGRIVGNSIYGTCGGSLIGNRFVLTAAHCKGSNMAVLVADLDINDNNDGATPYLSKVQWIRIHPNYIAERYENDIAVIKTVDYITYTQYRSAIRLPDATMKNQNLDGRRVFVCGWGDTEYQGQPSSILKVVNVNVINLATCANAYKNYPATIDNRVFCAGVMEGGKDSCQGDSGGPLMIQESGKKPYIIGVVSNGYRCAEPGFPGIYTKVASFLDFIYNTMAQ